MRPGVDLRYLVQAGSVKELIVLKQPPAEGAETNFRFELNTGGLSPRTTNNGWIELADTAGQAQFMVPPAQA